MRRAALALTVIAAVLATVAAQRPPAGRITALVGGTLIDGYAGPPITNSIVLIDGDRISAVGQVGTLTLPQGAEVISTEGMSVLPGLWDMHVHTMIVGHADYDHWDKAYASQFESVIMPAAAKQLLMAGVTSARDLGAPLEASIAVRNRINAGQTLARRFTSPVPSSSTRPTPTPTRTAGASPARTMAGRKSARSPMPASTSSS